MAVVGPVETVLSHYAVRGHTPPREQDVRWHQSQMDRLVRHMERESRCIQRRGLDRMGLYVHPFWDEREDGSGRYEFYVGDTNLEEVLGLWLPHYYLFPAPDARFGLVSPACSVDWILDGTAVNTGLTRFATQIEGELRKGMDGFTGEYHVVVYDGKHLSLSQPKAMRVLVNLTVTAALPPPDAVEDRQVLRA